MDGYHQHSLPNLSLVPPASYEHVLGIKRTPGRQNQPTQADGQSQRERELQAEHTMLKAKLAHMEAINAEVKQVSFYTYLLEPSPTM
jgi:hypothetical protein